MMRILLSLTGHMAVRPKLVRDTVKMRLAKQDSKLYGQEKFSFLFVYIVNSVTGHCGSCARHLCRQGSSYLAFAFNTAQHGKDLYSGRLFRRSVRNVSQLLCA